MDNVREFNLAIDRYVDTDVPEQVEAAQQKIALQGLRGVVMKTPVRSGRARGSWITTINTPSEKISGRKTKSGNSTITSGSSVITQAPAFSTIWMTSNLPYIERLEGGYSEQSPNGMVATTVAELESQFNNIE